MKIRDVVITPVAFPDPPLLNAVGVHEPWALRTIIELVCDDGVVGLGESYGDDGFLTQARAAAEELAGLDVFDLNGLRRRVGRAITQGVVSDSHGLTGASTASKTALTVFSAFEVACLDAQGKATGRPVSDLLGGRVRDAVPFSAYLFYKWAGHPGQEEDRWGQALTPDEIVAQAREMIAEYGFGSIKLKGGVFPPEEEVEAIRALREAFPGHPLRIDPNAAWSVATSVRVGRELDGVLEYLEDPTPTIGGMAEVARQVPMPLATNMAVVAFEHIPEAVELGAIGVLLSDHHFWGGLRLSQDIATLCETFGIGLSMHSNSHLGISLAAMVHLASATPHLSYACDTHRPWQDHLDLLVPGTLRFADGAVPVPAGPGLGVELDRDALARMHEDYLRCGLRRRDDTTYMRSIVPDFEPGRGTW
jgi:glucarate dehydratase